MRNDARPVGHDAGEVDPYGAGDDRVHGGSAEPDARESVSHDRQSHIVNRAADEHARRDDADDPVMPAGDSTLNTKI